jgi:hypothetical protein
MMFTSLRDLQTGAHVTAANTLFNTVFSGFGASPAATAIEAPAVCISAAIHQLSSFAIQWHVPYLLNTVVPPITAINLNADRVVTVHLALFTAASASAAIPARVERTPRRTCAAVSENPRVGNARYVRSLAQPKETGSAIVDFDLLHPHGRTEPVSNRAESLTINISECSGLIVPVCSVK